MIKTQVQLPDTLYNEAKRVAREREMSLAEVVRRGVEYIIKSYPPLTINDKDWSPPAPVQLGEFEVPVNQWRILANDDVVSRDL